MSAENGLSPLGIKQEDLNLLRNDHVKFDCGPLVYRTVINWGFAKPEGISIKDRFDYLKIVENNKDKYKGNLIKWVDRNESKLQKCSFSDFDITALHDFLPILCHDKIAQTFTPEYDEQIKDPNTVESLLKKIKAFRNDVSHEYDEAVKESNFHKMKETMRECIIAAGQLYGKDQNEIDGKVNVLDDEFDKVLRDTTHFYENRVNYIAKKISSEVPANLLERYSPHFYVLLPGSWTKTYTTSDIFMCSKLSTIEDRKGNDDKMNKTVFPCTKIFNNTHNKFIVINGGPGSGKTTLMRNMCQNILQTSVYGSIPKYEKTEQFKIPIYIECRNEQQANLAKFLRDCLKNFHSPEDDILESFKIVKCLIFLIDGYDEINNNCRQLVDSIIDFCKDYNASCIVSSRVDAGNNFVNKLQRMNFNCTKMFIEPISEMSDQVKFLKNFADKLDDSIDTDKLVNSFENLTAAAKEVFSSPILLAIFISLFVHEPDSVSRMKNEQSAYEAVRTSFLREMEIKLENVHNPKGRAVDVAKVLSKFCLKFFKAKKYHFYEEEYLKMVAECENIRGMPEYVDIPNLLSCILTPEHSFKFTFYTSYQFMHSTIQEFFAAKYVSEIIRELQQDRSSQSQSESVSENISLSKLLHAIELDVTQSDIIWEMKRYSNILKFLVLETLANGELSKYSNSFTQLLKRYIEPEDYYPNAYHLDLILSSDSNADVISLVADSMTDWGMYELKYYKHIKPMTEVVQRMIGGVKVDFNSHEVTNTQQIINLLTVMGDDSEIIFNLNHSYDNYQPLEGEFYTHLKNSKCKVTKFVACIASGEHLSIVVRVLRGNGLFISTPSVSEISFAALEEFTGELYLTLRVKYTDDCPGTGRNPVRERTYLGIDHIPADGKEKLYNIIKYICPKFKVFSNIHLHHCHLTDTDANELLMQLQKDKIRTENGRRTEVKNWSVNKDNSRLLELRLKESEEEKREKEEIEKEKRIQRLH